MQRSDFFVLAIILFLLIGIFGTVISSLIIFGGFSFFSTLLYVGVLFSLVLWVFMLIDAAQRPLKNRLQATLAVLMGAGAFCLLGVFFFNVMYIFLLALAAGLCAAFVY